MQMKNLTPHLARVAFCMHVERGCGLSRAAPRLHRLLVRFPPSQKLGAPFGKPGLPLFLERHNTYKNTVTSLNKQRFKNTVTYI